MLKLDTLRSTPLQRDPFEYLIVRDFVEREKLKQVLSDYPEVPCLLYTSPSPRDGLLSRMPSSA